jgi:hypothetical protein
MVDVVKLGLAVDTTGLVKAQTALKKFGGQAGMADKQADQFKRTMFDVNAGVKKFTPAITKASSSAAKAGKQFTFAKNGVQQLGFQVQDIAVQLGGGQSPFIVLAQQGSQIASIFGPSGAVFGAVLAIGGAIAGALLPSLFKASKGFDELLESATEAAGGLDKISAAQADFLAVELLNDIKDQREEFQGYTQDLEKNSRQLLENDKTISKLKDSYNANDIAVKNSIASIQAANKGLVESNRELRFNIETTGDSIDANEERLQTLKEIANGESILTKAQQEAANKRIQTLREISEAEDANLLQGTQKIEESLLSREEQLRLAGQRRIDIAREAEERGLIDQQRFDQIKIDQERQTQQQIDSIQQASVQSQLGVAGNLFGTLASIAKEGGKEQFENYKLFSIGQATIAGSLAVIKALAEGGPFLGPALATAAGALTAVQIGQIKQQKYQPRALGGQVNAGGEYLVGERGPEILRLGNKSGNITPNNQINSGSSTSVTNVFQISGDADQAAITALKNALPTIEARTVGAVQKALRSGGSMSRAAGLRR